MTIRDTQGHPRETATQSESCPTYVRHTRTKAEAVEACVLRWNAEVARYPRMAIDIPLALYIRRNWRYATHYYRPIDTQPMCTCDGCARIARHLRSPK